MLNPIVKLLSIINSETEPSQISLGFAFAMVAGLTPFFGVHNILVFLLVCILRVNLSAFMAGTAFFSALAYALDPAFHAIGMKVLTLEALRGPWTALYNVTAVRLTRFYNTIFMGSFVVSIALFVPLLLASNLLIRKYRANVLSYVEKTRIVQAYKASNFYRMYQAAVSLRRHL